MGHAIVVGAGYVGRPAAERLAAQGWQVTALVHSKGSAGQFAGLEARALDVTAEEAVRKHAALFEAADALIYCVSSGRGGAEAYRSAYVQGLAHVLEAAPSARVIFTSSTSVYARIDGAEVDERAAAEPGRETGRILREAEEMALARGGKVARLGGIYGPGRSVYLKKFLDGTAVIEGDGSRWVNQVHRDDAARALVHLTTAEEGSTIYNVVDDTPMTQRGIYELLAAHFQLPLPPGGPIDLERKRGWTSKRVRNARLRGLGWTPEYPGYAEAIRRHGAALLDPETPLP